MRIVIDGRMYRESGIGRYIRNLIINLENLDKKNEYFIILQKKDFDNLKFQKNFKKIQADVSWYGISEQISLPGILNKVKPDLIHFPHFNIPIFYKGKFVVTIHDLIHKHFKMKRATALNPIFYVVKHFGYNKVFKSAITNSSKILVPSNYVKNLLIKEWSLSTDKILVTYEAVDGTLLRIGERSDEETNRILSEMNIRPPFIFYVGNAHPHKNVEGLIKSFLDIRKKYQYLSLVLSGNDHYFWKKIKKENENENIIFTGGVTDEQLVALYKSARVFVLPSFEEGFGIPVLEAMSFGCPVACSNRGSLPEVASDAASYFDPENINDISDKITEILNNDKLRKELILKGGKRVKLFSWDKLAKQTLEVYKQCV